MNNFYLFLSSQDSLNVCKNNSSSDFWLQLPKTYFLEGQWLCSLKQVSFTCDLDPRPEDPPLAQIS